MNKLSRWLVWLSRINRCRGFGIQSPSDYAFVRYVVNEQWPYYAYQDFQDQDALTCKLGRLYFRLANWRQPSIMPSDRYQRYWQAGCRKIRFVDDVDVVELARIDIEDTNRYEQLLTRCNEDAVLVVEGISRQWQRWHEMERDQRTGVTFDLYYCGIILFDKDRYKQNYRINF